jgi:hypothetical protein
MERIITLLLLVCSHVYSSPVFAQDPVQTSIKFSDSERVHSIRDSIGIVLRKELGYPLLLDSQLRNDGVNFVIDNLSISGYPLVNVNARHLKAFHLSINTTFNREETFFKYHPIAKCINSGPDALTNAESKFNWDIAAPKRYWVDLFEIDKYIVFMFIMDWDADINKQKPSDRDEDGIPDKEDKCPDVAGSAKLQGCPNADEDGIPDHQDSCPNQFGHATAGGCPDADGDGIPDDLDKCPYTGKGRAVNELGCANHDGDSCYEDEDDDDDIFGPAECGCVPCQDMDNDGIPDIHDKCPDVPGHVEYEGCPALDSEQVKKALVPKVQMGDITFPSGESTLQPGDNKILDAIAEQKLTDDNFKWGSLLIVGLADETDRTDNKKLLALERAEALQTYLIGRGVSLSLIKIDSRMAHEGDEGNTRRATVFYVID